MLGGIKKQSLTGKGFKAQDNIHAVPHIHHTDRQVRTHAVKERIADCYVWKTKYLLISLKSVTSLTDKVIQSRTYKAERKSFWKHAIWFFSFFFSPSFLTWILFYKVNFIFKIFLSLFCSSLTVIKTEKKSRKLNTKNL